MTTRKKRYHIYLADDMAAALEALGQARGASMSGAVEAALRTWVGQSTGHALDDRFALRLDRLSHGHETVVERLDFLTEAFGTFVQHQLTLVAHRPAFTPETAQLGQARFQHFIEVVGRKLARRRARGGGGVEAGAGMPSEPGQEN